MGLFDKIKTKIQEKVNEVHVCYKCGKEYTGILSGYKLTDGKEMCSDCYPSETKLMKQKGVCDDFAFYKLDSAGMDAYLKYRENEKMWASVFNPTKKYLHGKFLVDEEHNLFKLKEYDEVFPIRQIEYVTTTATHLDDKIDVFCGFLLNNNIYKNIVVSFTIKCKSLLKKNQFKEYYSLIEDFHEEVCPDADLDMARF